MFTSIQSHFESGTLVLELVNPTVNHTGYADPINAEVFAAGIEAMNGAESNPDIHAVLITAKTPPSPSAPPTTHHQCVGHDADWEKLSTQLQAQADGFANWADTIYCYPKPVIAALHGCVPPQWMALALMCDGVVAESSTVFTMESSLTTGKFAKSSLIWALLQTLPRPAALEFLSSPTSITASRLHQLGAINRLANDNQAISMALQWCASLETCDSMHFSVTKETCNEVKHMTLTQAIQHERNQILRWAGKQSTA